MKKNPKPNPNSLKGRGKRVRKGQVPTRGPGRTAHGKRG